MYDQLMDQYDWIAIRTCNKCKQQQEILQSDLVYKRNPNAWFKKECYTYCKTESCNKNKIHISKTFIPKEILATVPKDNSPYKNFKGYTRQELLNLQENVKLGPTKQCVSCHCVNRITYNQIQIGRSIRLDPVYLFGSIYVFINCEQCGTRIYLDSYEYKLFIEDKITEYDEQNRTQNLRNFMKNIPIGILTYSVWFPFIAILYIPYILLIKPRNMMWKYIRTKDNVERVIK